ncbi:MAG: YkgJ family cysteine cluster protein [Pyrinomonadaceae bacterium]|nr:YkgJ family cysteine cluster protein [Pyrinomonadaceae bacterium]
MDHKQLVQITKRGTLSREEFAEVENTLYEFIWGRLFPPQILTDDLSNTVSENVITDPAAPKPDCKTCGACCAAFVVVDAENSSITSEKLWAVDSISDNGERATKSILRRREPDFACAGLAGEVGDEVSCTVYDNRPSMCRKFEAGSDRCHAVRRAYGIEPFLTTDEMLEANRKLTED